MSWFQKAIYDSAYFQAAEGISESAGHRQSDAGTG